MNRAAEASNLCDDILAKDRNLHAPENALIRDEAEFYGKNFLDFRTI